jgi:tetratricopeptide (TPR) repeat protein
MRLLYFIFAFSLLLLACGENTSSNNDSETTEEMVEGASTNQSSSNTNGRVFKGDELTAQRNANAWYQKAILLWNKNGAGYLQPDSVLMYVDSALYYYEFAAAYNVRGQVKVQLGRIQEAIPDYDRAISLDSTIGQPYFNRGTAYYIMSKMDLACANWGKAAELGLQNAQMAIGQYCR